jgi:hypothetical protein
MWAVEYTNEFEAWWNDLTQDERDVVADHVAELEVHGPTLDYPATSKIAGSVYNLRELRIQVKGRPYRVLYAFDPRRTAVLLIGGDKTGQNRWYDIWVPKAEKIYAQYLDELRREGLLPP